jgi:P-type Ca2+ transporter type 2C
MQYVLVGAALVSMVALQEFATGVAILGITVLNAILGLHQEGKAAESIAALQKMLIIKAHLRRDGALADIPSEELVPGDVISFEAGDKIPADGLGFDAPVPGLGSEGREAQARRWSIATWRSGSASRAW